LTSAIEKGIERGSRMRFRVTEPVVLEVQAVTTKDAHGKVGWKVVELGGSYTAANTHKITLKLSPEWWDEQKRVYTTDFLISATVPLAKDLDATESSGGDPAPRLGPAEGLDEEITDE
jgi:hypothetical protein